MIAIAAQDRRELNRWIVCGTIVLCTHAAVVASLMRWHEPVGEGDFGNDVILLELRPEQVQAEPTPEKPAEQVEQKPDLLPQQQSDVMLTSRAPVPQVEPAPQEPLPPAPVTSAAQAARARAAIASWHSEISRLIEHNKRYPEGARTRRQEGVAELFFSIDRQGRVLTSRIVTSSGFAALDEEALAVVQRIQPFPPPPLEVADDEIKFQVPIRFGLR